MASNDRVSQNKYYDGYGGDIKEFTKRVEKTVLEYLNKTSTRFDALADDAYPVLYSKYCHAILFKSLGEEKLEKFYVELKKELKSLKEARKELVLCELVDELKRKIRINLSMDEEFFTVCGRIVVICDYLKKDKKSFRGEAYAEIYKRAKEAFDKDILRKEYDKYRFEALTMVRKVMKRFDEHHSYCQDYIYEKPLAWWEETISKKLEATIHVLSEGYKPNPYESSKEKNAETFHKFLEKIFTDYKTAVNKKKLTPDDVGEIYMKLSCLAMEYRSFICLEGFEAAIDYMTKVMAINNQYFDKS